jgi:pyruvate formate lyase activating enzyme
MSNHDIKGFIETSLCDWDGYVASVIFLPGCNFRCPFCQNGDLILRPGELPTIEMSSVAKYLSGLGDLAREIKQLGFKVKLDTNGTKPAVIERLLEDRLIDYIAMDVKAPLDDRYRAASGVKVNLADIRRSIGIVSDLGEASEFRTTLAPGLVGADEIAAIAQVIRGAEKYVLQRFVPENSLDNSMRRAVPYDDSFVADLLEIAGGHVKSCFYRGKLGVGLS